jgi:two-component system, NarL family, response regulator NreC
MVAQVRVQDPQTEAGPTPPPARRVFLVDDHAILREGITALLSLEADFEVVGHAGSIAEAVSKAPPLRPDLVITDLSMPGVAGVQGIVELRRQCPNARIAVLTVHNTEEHIRAALAAGADGYIVKDASRSELVHGLRSVLANQIHLCARSSARVVRSYLGHGNEPVATSASPVVTGREREILVMIANGQSNKRIALTINRSIKTVEKHRANLMRKLGLHNVADVTRFALSSGLLTEDALLKNKLS